MSPTRSKTQVTDAWRLSTVTVSEGNQLYPSLHGRWFGVGCVSEGNSWEANISDETAVRKLDRGQTRRRVGEGKREGKHLARWDFKMPLPVACGLCMLSMSTANQSQCTLCKHWRERAFTKLFPDQTSVAYVAGGIVFVCVRVWRRSRKKRVSPPHSLHGFATPLPKLCTC